jgi:WD40 repeat protein
VAFSPDGRTLASGNDGGTIGLWNVTNPAHPRLLAQQLTTSNGNTVNAMTFSPDGRILATGNENGTIGLWNVTNPAHPRLLTQQLTTSNSYGIFAVAFSREGPTLASNADGTILLWNLNVHYAINRICATAGSLTPRQWHHYIGHLAYRPLCAH